MRLNTSRRSWTVLGGFLTLALAAWGIWGFSGSSHPTSVSDGNSPDLAPGNAAMRAYVDPETGVLTQSHVPGDQSADLGVENSLSRSTEGLVEVTHPDGHVSVHLQGRFQSASVARINSDGQVETTCVETQAEADTFLNGAPVEKNDDEPEVR
jgi:hypothetical protein